MDLRSTYSGNICTLSSGLWADIWQVRAMKFNTRAACTKLSWTAIANTLSIIID